MEILAGDLSAVNRRIETFCRGRVEIANQLGGNRRKLDEIEILVTIVEWGGNVGGLSWHALVE